MDGAARTPRTWIWSARRTTASSIPPTPPDQCSDADFPNETTPDICFDRIEVGSAEDAAYAYCEGVFASADCVPRDDTPLLESGETAAGVGREALSRRNFANWYAYYRDRLSLTKTALSRVMYRLAPSVRFGYDGVADGAGVSGIRDTFAVNSQASMRRPSTTGCSPSPPRARAACSLPLATPGRSSGRRRNADPDALAYVEDIAGLPRRQSAAGRQPRVRLPEQLPSHRHRWRLGRRRGSGQLRKRRCRDLDLARTRARSARPRLGHRRIHPPRPLRGRQRRHPGGRGLPILGRGPPARSGQRCPPDPARPDRDQRGCLLESQERPGLLAACDDLHHRGRCRRPCHLRGREPHRPGR